MTTEPTDAEIIALADETRTGEPGRDGYILPISFARAVLAKWGTPQPVVREPLTDEQLWANDEIMSLNADLGWHMETIRMETPPRAWGRPQ